MRDFLHVLWISPWYIINECVTPTAEYVSMLCNNGLWRPLPKSYMHMPALERIIKYLGMSSWYCKGKCISLVFKWKVCVLLHKPAWALVKCDCFQLVETNICKALLESRTHSTKMTRCNSTFTVAQRHECGGEAKCCVAVPVAGLIQVA